ncbi:Bug family tripartite tricarboxylate transporter substrate binding protein [Marinobacter sp. X15-166B]|uniref:Bug family tripartite tricarboxylate transporter substrate binding protein n=1 Tax=Marinobacter sp. X15-166B TaxID=1897620 RepID=UPI00085C4347|nr:tripartite tricarboxylate transporter substrate binding protein [Marinobacter sp. X15-166B]OEY66117.1 hypothetical protein BG841_06355 [Marinobacter sp. X15-166B]
MKTTQTILSIILAAACALPGWAVAEDFPKRPIELVVPYGAGGTTDVFARSFSRVISKYLPNEQRVVVVNKPGGAATIGMSLVAASKADGYTLAFTPSGTLEVMPHYGRTRWSLDDFEPVMSFLEIPASINVRKDSDIKDFEQFKEFASANPNQFTYATSGGTGASTHLAMEYFSEVSELAVRHIPFEGQAAAQSALLGGQVMGTFSIPDIHKGGEIRPLVFLTEARPLSEVYQDIPTATEAGVPVTASFPMAILAPQGVPPERLKIIHDAFKAAMDDPEVVKFFDTAGLPRTYKDGETLGEGMRERSAKNKRLLEQLGLI